MRVTLRPARKSRNLRYLDVGVPMRYSLFLGRAAMLGAIMSPVAAAAADTAPSHDRQAIAAAGQALDARDCVKVAAILAPLLAAPPAAEGRDVADAFDISIRCALGASDLAKATDFAGRAIAVPAASDYAWHMAIGLNFNAGKFGAGIDAIERMRAEGRGAAFNSIDVKWLMQALFALQKSGDDANETRLLRVMADPAYNPDDVQAHIEGVGDYARTLYARKLLAAGKRDEARAIVSDIQGYDSMAQVAFDPALRALLGHPVDLRAVAEADLVRHRALLDRYPQALSAIVVVSFDLRRLGRYDEDIAFLTAAIPAVAKPSDFDDADEMVPWFWNALGYGYYMTGKYDAMVAAFARGNWPNKAGLPNVELSLNLAEYQVDFNRPKDALATLAPFNGGIGMTPPGLMRFHLLHGCAQAELGDLAAARADLAYAQAHEKDNARRLAELELCVGEEDAAAASYIRQLQDTNRLTRQSAIIALADYDPPDPRAPKSPFADREERVRKRADVDAALRAAVGGPVRVRLQVEP